MIPMNEQARAVVVTEEDRRSVVMCYADPDITVPTADGSRERRVGCGWVLVVLADGTVDQAFRWD